MDFNFVDPDDSVDEEEEYLDLSDLFDEDEKAEVDAEELEIAGYEIAFEEDVPEAMSITDPEVKRRARKARKSKSSSKPSMFVGSNTPYVHGLCKQGVAQDAKTLLPAHHSVCKRFEEWNVRAGIPCACEECDHPQSVEELDNGKDARQSSLRSKRGNVRSEPKSLQGSDEQEFVLRID